MEPNKIEKQMREKLNAREIQPSAHSWDRLDAMLSVQEESSKKAGFPWLKMAAGFVLFVGIAFMFLTQKESHKQLFENNQSVVESSTQDEAKSNKNSSKAVQSERATNSEMTNAVIASVPQKSNAKVVTQQAVYVPLKEIKNQESNTIVAEVKTEKMEDKQNVMVKNEAPVNFESKEVIAENKIISKPKLKVDANALLNQVEGEVTLTFRQKVMKSMIKNYKDAKESFASRNLEESSNN